MPSGNAASNPQSNSYEIRQSATASRGADSLHPLSLPSGLLLGHSSPSCSSPSSKRGKQISMALSFPFTELTNRDLLLFLFSLCEEGDEYLTAEDLCPRP